MNSTRAEILSHLSLYFQGPEQSLPHRDYVSMVLNSLEVDSESLGSTVYPRSPPPLGVPDHMKCCVLAPFSDNETET